MIGFIPLIVTWVRWGEEFLQVHAEEGVQVSLFFPADPGHAVWAGEQSVRILTVRNDGRAMGVQVLCFDYDKIGGEHRYPMQLLIDLTVDEYLQYVRGSLPLPPGWDIEIPLHLRCAQTSEG